MTLLELLADQNIAYRQVGQHHHATTGWVSIDCPYCSPNSSRFRLGINLTKYYTACWTCGHHPFLATLAELTGLSTTELSTLLDRPIGPTTRPERKKGTLILPPGLGPILGAHKRYLEGRGFSVQNLTKLWKVGGIGFDGGQWSWRLFIPIHLHGDVVSWTTRTISDEGTRYISAPATHEITPSKTLLYGEDYAKHTIIVCEGPTDVWRIGPGAVATLGIQFTREQASKVAKYPNRIICFDNEPTAQKQAQKLCSAVASLPGKTSNIVLDSKDPGSTSKKELKWLRKLLES